MGVSTFESEAVKKGGICSIKVGNELLPQVKEFRYLRVWVNISSTLISVVFTMVCDGEEGADPKGNATDVPVDLDSNP